MEPKSKLYLALQKSLTRRRNDGSLRSLKVQKAESLERDFSSNDYLDLSSSPVLRNLFEHYLKQSTSMASTGSRLLSGNNALAETIEDEAKSFWNSSDALLCSSGYEANVSIFSTLPQPGDTIIFDELTHASVHVGMKSSRASQRIPFRHNDVRHLRQILQEKSTTKGNTFLAVESVYSMDGDLAPLHEILNVVREIRPNTHLILDEAHATGVFGASGQGLAHHVGVHNAPEILVRLHTLGKGAAGTGAIILCPVIVKEYLLNYAKGLIYSTYMSIPALCLARAAIKMLNSAENKQAMSRLFSNIEFFQEMLSTITQSQVLLLPVIVDSPIVPLVTTRAVELSAHLEREGFRVMPVRYPTVPKGSERLRICLRANISRKIMLDLVTTLDAWVKNIIDTGPCISTTAKL